MNKAQELLDLIGEKGKDAFASYTITGFEPGTEEDIGSVVASALGIDLDTVDMEKKKVYAEISYGSDSGPAKDAIKAAQKKLEDALKKKGLKYSLKVKVS